MTLDNVLDVSAAAQGSRPLLMIGLGIIIPLFIYGSTLILTFGFAFRKVMKK